MSAADVRRGAAAIAALAAVAYPLALHVAPRLDVLGTILALLVAALLLRVLVSNAAQRLKALALAGALLLGLLGWSIGTERLVRLQPALLNAALLVAFGSSLARGVPLIERIARARRMPVGVHNLGYLRALTAVWTGFFAIATLLALATLAGSEAAWLWWNGGLVYAAILALVAGERLYREVYRRRLAREGRLPPGA